MGVAQTDVHHHLTERVTVLRKTSQSQDLAGGTVYSFVVLGDCDSRFSPVGGDKAFIQGQHQVNEAGVFWLNDGVGIQIGDRLQDADGRRWEIRGVRTRDADLKRIFAVEVK